MTTPNQKATLERMLMVHAGIYFDSDEGAFLLLSNFNHQKIDEINPQTVCSLIKGKYIESGEHEGTILQFTSKGLAEAERKQR